MPNVRMQPDWLLDYAIFQLTPTRTRCELLVAAQGSTYKLASGLLKPFVSHLKSAEEQLTRGGYSIRLEPPDPGVTPWFTKGTMERFVRFVSTPELLERVSTVEVELIELDETSDRQHTAENCEPNSLGQVENQQPKSSANPSPGGKSNAVATSNNKLSKATPDSTETGVEEGSKQRLLRALEARRVMLQKEQGMAFARAFAAGFSLENIGDLVLFSECFGAARLREACTKFMELCKKRQEAGLEIEEIDFANSQAEMAAYLGSGGVESWSNSHADVILTSDNGTENLTGRGSLDEATKEQFPSTGNGDTASGAETGRGPIFVQGHPMLSPWQGHPQNQYMQNGLHHAPYGPMSYGLSAQALPSQPGLPYPQYLGSPFMAPQPYPHIPPQYWPGSHPESISSSISRAKEPTKLNGDEEYHEDTGETLSDEMTRRSAKGSASTRRRSSSPMRRVQIGRSGGSKRSGTVVIRNINYISSKTQKPDDDDDDDDDDDESTGSWASEDSGNADDGRFQMKAETLRGSVDEAVGLVESLKHGNKDGKRSKKAKKKSSSNGGGVGSKAIPASGNESESETGAIREDGRHEPKETEHKVGNEQKSMISEDSILFMNRGNQRNSIGLALDTCELEHTADASKESRISNQYSTADMVLVTQREANGKSIDSHSFYMLAEQEQQANKQMVGMDDSIMVIPDNHSTTAIRDSAIMDPENDFAFKAVDKKLSDDSFILLDRSATSEGANHHEWRVSLNLDSEMPLEMQSSHNVETSVGNTATQEPDMFEPQDSFMVPDRSKDAYKRAWDNVEYDMQVFAADMMENEHHNQTQDDEDAETGAHEQEDDSAIETKKTVSKGVSEKDAKAKAMKEMLERRRSMVGGRGAPGRPNPLAEAQLRAEKLRAYKAALQKSKKEKEEEDRKRIENLKNQRKERIAARTLSAPASNSINRAPNSITPPKQTQKLFNANSVSPRDKASSAARLAQLSSPKSIGGPVKENRKSTPVLSTLRASTGSPIIPSKKPISYQSSDILSDTKTNGIEENGVPMKAADPAGASTLGQTPSGRTYEKTVIKSAVSDSINAKTVKKSAVSDSINAKTVKHSIVSGSMDEKTVKQYTVSDSMDKRTVKKSTVSDNTVKSLKLTVGTVEAIEVKKAPVSVERRASPAPQAKAVREKTATTEGNETSQQKDVVSNDDKPEIIPMPAEPQEIIKSVASANGHGDGNNGFVPHQEAGPRADGLVLNEEKLFLGLQTPSASHRAKSPDVIVSAPGTGEAELEIEKSSNASEDCQYAPIVHHGSSSQDISTYIMEADPNVGSHMQPPDEDLSPHFSPSWVPVSSPSLNIPSSDESKQLDSSHDGSLNSRSRKKWGDSKAKGLKKFLLLGRKSKNSPGVIPSEGEEEESSSNNDIRPNEELDCEQVSGLTPPQSQSKSEGSSSSKGSRSFFSLSLRGKSNAVKA